ncbi:MAG: glycosyltransferase family 2 protein [Microcoleaceae cyanobacterium]
MPKVSVCIPTFNRVQLLPLAIESVLQQTEPDWELLVCDDGSNDGTAALMSQYTDPRIRYIRHPQNIGKSNNMRSGFEAATGQYFIKFDDDDRLTSGFLEKTTTILDQYPGVDFVGTDHWIIDINNVRDQAATTENSNRWGRSNLPEGIANPLLNIIFVQQSFQIGATLFRRAVLQAVGYMRPNIQNCEDNDLLVRLALAGKQAYYLPERLMEYRVHSEQQGLGRAVPYLQDKLQYLDSYRFEDETLEQIRQSRFTETQLLLGLRLIEQGNTQTGRQLTWAAKQYSPAKAWAGLFLSVLPLPLRHQLFNRLRR